VCGSPEFCTKGEGNLPFTASLEARSRCTPSKADRHQGVRHDLPHGIARPRREIQETLLDKVLVVHRPAAITPCGQVIGPTSKPLENTNYTLASSMNLRRRSEASMRIDAAATRLVFGILRHQVMTLIGRPRKPPSLPNSTTQDGVSGRGCGKGYLAPHRPHPGFWPTRSKGRSRGICVLLLRGPHEQLLEPPRDRHGLPIHPRAGRGALLENGQGIAEASSRAADHRRAVPSRLPLARSEFPTAGRIQRRCPAGAGRNGMARSGCRSG